MLLYATVPYAIQLLTSLDHDTHLQELIHVSCYMWSPRVPLHGAAQTVTLGEARDGNRTRLAMENGRSPISAWG